MHKVISQLPNLCTALPAHRPATDDNSLIGCTRPLASCLIYAQPLPAHRPATDDNTLISHKLTDDWSLASTHFVNSQYEFWSSFECVLLSNQIYLTTMY